MTFEELKDKARSLPLEPGVYLMQDETGRIIYVGKAKKLKNRVSQYFQDTASHTAKTRRMVSRIDRFDVIVAATEFEALVLECSLIKRHMPKYNILLKDDKGYPYLRVDLREEYPVMELVGRIADDGAEYYGPFGGRSVAQNVIDTLRLCLKLPGCAKRFPRDLGKDRPCLNYHMNNCDGWCQLSRSPEEYRERMRQAVLMLEGKYQQVSSDLKEKMELAAENLDFETAAILRDRLRAVESIGQRQLVTAATMANTDVIGYYQSEVKACFAVLHYVDGNLLDKDYEILQPSDDEKEALSSLVKQYYLARGAAPKQILLPFEMDDSELFEQLLLQQLQKKVRFRVPMRGDGLRLSELANKNAKEEAERVTSREEKLKGSLLSLQSMLKLENPLHRIESYDISNTAGTDIVSSMVCFKDGRPSKKDYKHFKIEGLTDQDDYASMRQTVHRRFAHYLAKDEGFSEMPDALLIDGGQEHALCVLRELTEMGISVPIFGMVKDNRHRTRALLTPHGEQISISEQPAVFALVGQIQEETHRFAITYHRKLRSRHVRASKLEQIPGIGPKRRAELLKRFGSVRAISEAPLSELRLVLNEPSARAVFAFFHEEGNEQ